LQPNSKRLADNALTCDSEGNCMLKDELAGSDRRTWSLTSRLADSDLKASLMGRTLYAGRDWDQKTRLMTDTSSNTWSPTLMTDDLLLGQCTPLGYSCQDSMHCCDKLACIRTGGSGGMMTTACGVNPFPRL